MSAIPSSTTVVITPASHNAATAEGDYAAQIRAFYATHNPAKLPEVPALLQKYAGKLRKLLASLHKKYGKAHNNSGAAASASSSATTTSALAAKRGKRRAVDVSKDAGAVTTSSSSTDVPVDYGDDDDDDGDDDADSNGNGSAPATKKARGQGKHKRPKATVFCCAKCGHDCLEVKAPIRIAALPRRNSDGSAVVDEKALLKSLRAVAGKADQFPRRNGGTETRLSFLCSHCSAALGYRHKPLNVPAKFCYFQRGSIVSSKSDSLGSGPGKSGSAGALEESTSLVCHVTPGTNKACITAIDDNDEVRGSSAMSCKVFVRVRAALARVRLPR